MEQLLLVDGANAAVVAQPVVKRVCKQQPKSVVAKRLNEPYLPGERISGFTYIDGHAVAG